MKPQCKICGQENPLRVESWGEPDDGCAACFGPAMINTALYPVPGCCLGFMGHIDR